MKKSQIIIGVIVLVLIGWYGYKAANKVAYEDIDAPRPFKGREDAKIVLDEFSDFQCPGCKSAVDFVKDLDEKYGANIRINYRHFPLKQIHKYALPSAIAAECGNDQGKFWEMHDAIFSYQTSGQTDSNLRKAAQDAKLDLAKYDACVANKANLSVVEADEKAAMNLNLPGTPSFVLNGKIVSDRAQLEPMIKKELGLE